MVADLSNKTGARYLSALWIAVAGLATLSLALINGGPLYYFDTGAHLADWQAVRAILFGSEAGGLETGSGSIAADMTVNGSRPPVYGILIGAMAQLMDLRLSLLPQCLALWLALWLAIRACGIAHRSFALAMLCLAGAAGSLPFIAAYLMPDLFAAVLILSLSLLIAFPFVGRGMQMGLLALACLSVVTHMSHIGIAAGFLAVALLAALVTQGRAHWGAAALVALVVVAGVAERLAFVVATRVLLPDQAVEVRLPPFVTARLISDGPGLRYLHSVCPDQTVPECALMVRIGDAEAAQRRKATSILYGEALTGSYRLLPSATQTAIARNQPRFIAAVLMREPLAVAQAAADNFRRQLLHVNVWMSFPNQEIRDKIVAMTGALPPELSDLRFPDRPDWLGTLSVWHRAVYGVSLITLVVLILSPQRPAHLRAFAGLLILGIAINALVCGALSQPAPRYGARVAFLLPMAPMFLWLIPRQRGTG